jgi:hypothetical protein
MKWDLILKDQLLTHNILNGLLNNNQEEENDTNHIINQN